MENSNAPRPQTNNLSGYKNLEIPQSSNTGIETLLSNNEGYIVGRLGNELLRYNTDAHFLTVSPTGGGKTTGIIIPNLLDHPGSAFVVDIRGETVAKTATAKRLLGHRVVVLDPFEITGGEWGIDSYNVFDRVTEDLKAIDVDDRIQRIINALMFDPSGRMSNEPIWDNATRNLLIGLVSYCVKYLPKRKHNLVEILDILNYNNNELEWFIAEVTSLIENNEVASNDRQLKGLVKILTEGKTKTKITDNALVQAQTLLTWVGNKSFKGILDSSSFRFSDMQDRKMTVYLVVPEEYIDNCASWVRLLIESAVFSMKDVFKTKGINTAILPQHERILFLLDELPAFGQLDIISKGMATLRGRGINLWLFLQNIAQLDDIYGEKKSRTIIGNAAAMQLFNSNELQELEYFSKLIGEEFYDVQSVTIGETNTQGESLSLGTSNTINNSESVTQTKGTSDSISEATNITWNNSQSKSKSRNKSINKGKTLGTGKSSSSSYGNSENSGESFNRNMLQGNQKGKGNSHNRTKGKSNNQSKTKNIGSTIGQTLGVTESKGGGKTHTKTTGTTESHSFSQQKGYSDTTSETKGTNTSYSDSRSISVKQERMKIETIRSLREKLSGRNQLIQIRGFQPFFTPRMSYFVKFQNTNQYMFPDMVSLIDPQTIEKIFEDYLSESLGIELNYSKNIEIIETLIKTIEDSKIANNYPRYDTDKLISQIQIVFSKTLPEILQKFENVFLSLNSTKNKLDKLSKTIFCYLKIMGNLDIDSFFSETIDEVNIRMSTYEDILNSELHLKNDLLNQFKELPLMNIDNGYDSLSGKKYSLSSNDYEWLIVNYSELLKKILKDLKKDAKIVSIGETKKEEIKEWFNDLRLDIIPNYRDAINIIIEKEIKERHTFYRENL